MDTLHRYSLLANGADHGSRTEAFARVAISIIDSFTDMPEERVSMRTQGALHTLVYSHTLTFGKSPSSEKNCLTSMKRSFVYSNIHHREKCGALYIGFIPSKDVETKP
jgi:hypothetical protein